MKPSRAEIDLKASICTDNPTGTDIYQFGVGPEAQHVENTGIERQGGLTNLYRTETRVNLRPYWTDNGQALYVDTSGNVKLKEMISGTTFDLGNTGQLAVYLRGALFGWLDAAWTTANTILVMTLQGNIVTVAEFNPVTKSIVNTRDITFGAMVTANLKSICFVRYVDMAYGDNQEFYVRYHRTTEDQILKESGTSVTKVATNAINKAGFAHRFAVNKYIWGDQGVAGSWSVGDILFGGGGYTAQTNGKWCIIDRWRSQIDSRAILTYDVLKTPANTLAGISTVGYNGAGVYSATQTDYGVALAAVTATLSNKINGPGYSEATYTRSDTGTNIYSYIAPFPSHTAAAYYDVMQTQTQTAYNGYGCLSDIDGNRTWKVKWRMGVINGVPSFISAAEVATGNDNLGVPITNVGEVDPYYVPMVSEWADPVFGGGLIDSGIIYRYNGTLFYVWASEVPNGRPHRIERVSSTLYQINSLSPINLVDSVKRTLNLGANDYNGRMRWSSAGAIVSTYSMASNLSGDYANSIDPGAKLVTQTLASGVGIPYGIECPATWNRPIPYSVKIYATQSNALSYYQSTVTQGTFYTDLSQSGILFVNDTRLPIGMGYHFGDRMVSTEIETIFTGVGVIGATDVNYSYVGYEIGNVGPLAVAGFMLFGQRYVFDGTSIRQASFTGPIFSGTIEVATATGLTFVSSSPTAAYFLSSFDNSLFSFDGGRSVVKMKRLNDMEAVQNGVFGVYENTLLLQTANTWIFVRDGVVTSIGKTAAEIAAVTGIGLDLFSTAYGIIISYDEDPTGVDVSITHVFYAANYNWIGYTFSATDGTTKSVLPFMFQSAYFGVTHNVLGVVHGFNFAIRSPTRAAASFSITVSSFDSDGEWSTELFYNLTPSDWTPLGLFRARIIPERTMSIAVSVGFKTSSRLLLTSIVPEFTEDAMATPAASRSK